jgi:uroporphyrin-3 C-methyltransferase
VAALVLAGAAMLVSLLLWQRLSTMQEQLARQNLDAGNQSVEARTLARQAQEQALEAGTRVSVLEGRVGELAAQRAQIDALISAASRSADDSLIADLEASLRTAQEQTQLTGSASPLLAALQSAQRRVAASSAR